MTTSLPAVTQDVHVRRCRSALVALAVLALAAATAGCGPSVREQTVPARLAAAADAAPTPELDWTDCEDERLGGYRCALATVPLDYSRPEGPTIDIAVVKQPASHADRRAGTRFAAAGGPGDSGLGWARRGRLRAGQVLRRRGRAGALLAEPGTAAAHRRGAGRLGAGRPGLRRGLRAPQRRAAGQPDHRRRRPRPGPAAPGRRRGHAHL